MDRFEEVKLRVKEASDLVALIESYLPLRRAGRNLVALCPFHPEKTPSFTVHPESQHYKCYGCGKAGDVFSFLMEREGLSFREALESLAQRAGVSIEGVFGQQRRTSTGMEPHEALAEVQRFFAAELELTGGHRARSYLESRGLASGIEPFGLGVHPSEPGCLLRFAQKKKLPLDVLEQAGLLREGREPFYGRVMFPIEDARGRILGFGGRALDNAPAKYLNSPESPFFRKRMVLYGLRRAKAAGERRIVVVEGYTDVIACHLAGFHGAVATLGTALTPDHGRLLIRYATSGVVLLFDGDRAGRSAAEKAYAELVRTELPLRTALLPEGMDPADLLAPKPGLAAAEIEQRRSAFAAILDGAEDALDMWFRLKRARMDLRSEANVAVAVEECARVLEVVDDPSRAVLLRDRMARQLGLDVATFQQTLRRRRAAGTERRAAADSAVATAGPRRLAPIEAADAAMLACVLVKPSLAGQARPEVDVPAVATLLAAAAEAVEQGCHERAALLRVLFARCGGETEASQLLAHAADLADSIKDPDETFEMARRQHRAFNARSNARQLRLELQQARADGDGSRVEELTQRYIIQLREAT